MEKDVQCTVCGEWMCWTSSVISSTRLTGKSAMALFLENDSDVTMSIMNDVLGKYDGVLPEEWYLDALPNDFIGSHDLRYDKLIDRFDGVTLPESSAYLESEGYRDSDPSRGFS